MLLLNERAGEEYRILVRDQSTTRGVSRLDVPDAVVTSARRDIATAGA